jgi:hypothetical protein
MPETLINILWALIFSMIGCLVGVALFITLAAKLPRLFDKLTPNIDEGKELVRGNQAVAAYYGRVVAAGIIGLSVIIAAAILGGLLAGLH